MSSVKKLLRVALAHGLTAFCFWYGISWLWWKIWPFQRMGQTHISDIIWATHAIFEKEGGLILMGISSILAARTYRPTWKIGVAAGLVTALLFQSLCISVYILGWGYAAYFQYNRFYSTLFYTVAIGFLSGFGAVWKDYRQVSKST
ncbi:hypothetical protein GC207_01970 [bacterium]|nr:hypothetical protein [bacterium]